MKASGLFGAALNSHPLPTALTGRGITQGRKAHFEDKAGTPRGYCCSGLVRICHEEAGLLGLTDLRESLLLEPRSPTTHTQQAGSWLLL